MKNGMYIEDEDKVWYKDGLKHRDNDLWEVELEMKLIKNTLVTFRFFF